MKCRKQKRLSAEELNYIHSDKDETKRRKSLAQKYPGVNY